MSDCAVIEPLETKAREQGYAPPKKLTQAQMRSLMWLCRCEQSSEAGAVPANGKPLCMESTMRALQERGIATQAPDGNWKTTEYGRGVARRLGMPA